MGNLTLAYNEYAVIIESVAKDYNDETEITDLRKDHPELNFMDNDEIQQILDYAKQKRIEMAAIVVKKMFEEEERLLDESHRKTLERHEEFMKEVEEYQRFYKN